MMKALLIILTAALSSCAIEKPKYKTLRKDGDFEVRKYAVIPIVSAPMDDMENRNDSFRSLFRYISGENKAGQKISMTAPVFMENEAPNKTTGRMSFMVPSEVSKKGAPIPNAEDVSVSKIDGGTFAVLKFKGWSKQESREEATNDLTKFISDASLKATEKPFFAFYNPPWTPEFLRKNEVWMRIDEP